MLGYRWNRSFIDQSFLAQGVNKRIFHDPLFRVGKGEIIGEFVEILIKITGTNNQAPLQGIGESGNLLKAKVGPESEIVLCLPLAD